MQIQPEVLWMWDVDGLQMHGGRSCRLVWKEVVEALSNYENKNSYFWWFERSEFKKTIVVYLLDLFEERGEKGQCDLVCVWRVFRWLG